MGSPSPTRRFYTILAAVVAVALALRVAYLATVGYDVANPTGFSDAHYYHGLVNLIADGRGFIDPFEEAGGREVPTASHGPLYPLLLSVVSLAGGTGFVSHRLLGLFFATCMIVLVAFLGRRVDGERTGLIAAGMAATYPVFIGADMALLSETLYGPLILACLVLAYRLHDRPGLGSAGALGAAIAFAALTRSEGLLLLPLLAFPLAWRGRDSLRERARLITACTLACAIVITPWTIRNWIAFDQFVPVSTQGGAAISVSNCDTTYYGRAIGFWDIECLSPRQTLNEAKQSEIWGEEGLDYARDNLGRLPVVIGARILTGYDLYNSRLQAYVIEMRPMAVQRTGVRLYYLLLPLAACGLLLLRRRHEPIWILLAPIVLHTLVSAALYGGSRLRHVAEFSIVVLAAIVVSMASARLGARTAGSTDAGAAPAEP